MSDILSLTLTEAAAKLKRKEITSVELTTALMNRIEQRNPRINAYITITRDKALAMAAESDKKLAAGTGGLIEGVPVGMKDLFCTHGTRTTAGSQMLKNFIPPYESAVSQNIWNHGGVCTGKLNQDEFGMGASGENSSYGTTQNPWDEARSPGGSSSGSSAAVSDYQCFAATGSDTGGSSRQPAALTGIVGFKPTYGRCSRYGMIAFASSLDHPSLFARTVGDAALFLSTMAGFDERDSTSVNIPTEPYHTDLAALPLKGLKIGLPKEYFIDAMDAAVRESILAAAKRFAAEGAEVIDISLPHTAYAVPTYYIINPAEGSSNLSRYDGMRFGERVDGENLLETYKKSRTAGLGREVKRRIMLGNYTLSSGYYDAYYLKAQQLRTLIARDFTEAYKKVDVILTPTTPTPAFKIGEKANDPVQMYLCDIFTVTANLTGLPAVSVPAGVVEWEGKKLPIGAQFIGKPFAEKHLLQVAHAHEQLTKFTPLTFQN